MGEALKDFASGESRRQLFITSKVWNDCHRPEAVRSVPARILPTAESDKLRSRPCIMLQTSRLLPMLDPPTPNGLPLDTKKVGI